VFVQNSGGIIVWQPESRATATKLSDRVYWYLELPRPAPGAELEPVLFSSSMLAFPRDTEFATDSIIVAVLPSGTVLTWFLASGSVANPPGEHDWAARFVRCTVGYDSTPVPVLDGEAVTAVVLIGYDEDSKVSAGCY
jgi:hypothetical protein